MTTNMQSVVYVEIIYYILRQCLIPADFEETNMLL